MGHEHPQSVCSALNPKLTSGTLFSENCKRLFWGAYRVWCIGPIGEAKAAKLTYLVVTSRLLDHPVSAVVKGPSSTGKSFLTDRVLAFFPPSATYKLTAMSERALA